MNKLWIFFQLNSLKDSILQVPLKNYEPDFIFIVNNDKYQTSKIVADLLSTQISQIHQIDPTFNQYQLSTQSKGNFQTILDLVSFEEKEIKENEFPFIKEVLTKLKTENFFLNTDAFGITIDNVIASISKHDSFPYFYKKNLNDEANFISSHFAEFDENLDISNSHKTQDRKLFPQHRYIWQIR